MAANNDEELSPTLYSSGRNKTRLNSSSKRLRLHSSIKPAGAKPSFVVVTESPQKPTTSLAPVADAMDNRPGPSTSKNNNIKQADDNLLDDDKENTLCENSEVQADDDCESDDDFEIEPKPANPNAKMNYLITYSAADVLKIKDRESFAEFVLRHF